MKRTNTFNKVGSLLVLFIAMCSTAYAQLSGTYTIGGSSPDYTNLKSAISDLNNNGVNGPVEFLIRSGSYSGSNWMGSIGNIAGASNANRITFRSQTGNKGDVTLSNSSSSNYIFKFNNARYITVRDMTLKKSSSTYCRIFDFGSTQASFDSVVNCALEASKTKSSSNLRALVYANDHTGSNNVFMNCEFLNGGTQLYWEGNGTGSPSSSLTMIGNEFTGDNSCYRGVYIRYTDNVIFSNNTVERTGTSTYYGTYFYYCDDNFEYNDNTVDINTTGTIYGLYTYRINYSRNASVNPEIKDNAINVKGSSSSVYSFYNRYGDYMTMSGNNVVAQNTTGNQYVYCMYNHYKSMFRDNNISMTKTSSSRTLYFYGAYNSANYEDSFLNNTVTLKRPNSGTIYNYMIYYGRTVMMNNNFNVSNKNSTTYNYIRYPENCVFAHNKLKSTSNSGTIYGLYDYSTSSSYSGGDIMYNDFEFESNGGTIYGLYPYRSKSRYRSNLVTSKTSGSNYTLRIYYNYGSKFVNNTFYSYATGGTNYAAYVYNTSSSYMSTFRNNIFSKKNDRGYGIYIYDKRYFDGDYNLYHVPAGGTVFYSRSPSYQGNKLQTWRDRTESDMNSLVYEPPFVDADSRDFNINANSPAAWAVNGRGMHDTLVKEDLGGTTRPIFAPDGVPDLGAYEVDPTSTPPNSDAIPANPVANSTQVFTFGQDTVGTIDWGSTVPATFAMRQYSGVQAAPMPAGVGRMYFYTAVSTSAWQHKHTANIRYKEPWIGDIPGENEAVIARSSNGGAWEGYNYTNANTNTVDNILSPATMLDSIGGYTGVQNGRIGIRCVKDPQAIVISNITAFDADLDWAPVFNPIGYQVVLKKQLEAPSVNEWNNASFPTSNSISLSGLDEDTKYYVYIRSVCGIKDTSGYSVDSFITLITCHDPTIGITDITDKRAVVYWNDIKTAVKYEYVINTSSTPPGFGTDINKTSVLESFLDADKQYYVHVRAHCSTIYSESDWTTEPFKTWPLGVSEVASDNGGLIVAPNPAHDNIRVTINGVISGSAQLFVLDVTGKMLLHENVPASTVNVDISSLSSGMYILRYSDDGQVRQVKFNKQ